MNSTIIKIITENPAGHFPSPTFSFCKIGGHFQLTKKSSTSNPKGNTLYPNGQLEPSTCCFWMPRGQVWSDFYLIVQSNNEVMAIFCR